MADVKFSCWPIHVIQLPKLNLRRGEQLGKSRLIWGNFVTSLGCRARIRTWAKGSKVLCATTTQLGSVLKIIALKRERGNASRRMPFSARLQNQKRGKNLVQCPFYFMKLANWWLMYGWSHLCFDGVCLKMKASAIKADMVWGFRSLSATCAFFVPWFSPAPAYDAF